METPALHVDGEQADDSTGTVLQEATAEEVRL